MSNVFNFKDITNGGANRFWATDDGDFLIGGSDVQGRFKTGDINNWIAKAAELYDGRVVSLGTIGGDGNANPHVKIQNNAIAKLTGDGIGGQYRFQFADVQDAENFGDFLSAVADTFVL